MGKSTMGNEHKCEANQSMNVDTNESENESEEKQSIFMHADEAQNEHKRTRRNSGLEDLISLILPEVDEEIENDPMAQQIINESPSNKNILHVEQPEHSSFSPRTQDTETSDSEDEKLSIIKDKYDGMGSLQSEHHCSTINYFKNRDIEIIEHNEYKQQIKTSDKNNLSQNTIDTYSDFMQYRKMKNLQSKYNKMLYIQKNLKIKYEALMNENNEYQQQIKTLSIAKTNLSHDIKMITAKHENEMNEMQQKYDRLNQKMVKQSNDLNALQTKYNELEIESKAERKQNKSLNKLNKRDVKSLEDESEPFRRRNHRMRPSMEWGHHSKKCRPV